MNDKELETLMTKAKPTVTIDDTFTDKVMDAVPPQTTAHRRARLWWLIAVPGVAVIALVAVLITMNNPPSTQEVAQQSQNTQKNDTTSSQTTTNKTGTDRLQVAEVDQALSAIEKDFASLSANDYSSGVLSDEVLYQ